MIKMNQADAARILNVSENASADEISQSFEVAQNAIERKIADAPNPTLKQKLRTKRIELETAFKTLSATKLNELPATSREDSRKYGGDRFSDVIPRHQAPKQKEVKKNGFMMLVVGLMVGFILFQLLTSPGA